MLKSNDKQILDTRSKVLFNDILPENKKRKKLIMAPNDSIVDLLALSRHVVKLDIDDFEDNNGLILTRIL